MLSDPPDSALASILARLEAKLDRLIHGPESPTVSTAEAMRLLSVRSRTTFYKLTDSLNVQPFARGRYRRGDILSAIGRIAVLRQHQHRRDAESELRSEARRLISQKPNPHD